MLQMQPVGHITPEVLPAEAVDARGTNAHNEKRINVAMMTNDEPPPESVKNVSCAEVQRRLAAVDSIEGTKKVHEMFPPLRDCRVDNITWAMKSLAAHTSPTEQFAGSESCKEFQRNNFSIIFLSHNGSQVYMIRLKIITIVIHITEVLVTCRWRLSVVKERFIRLNLKFLCSTHMQRE